jgi:hypothetical protein
MPTGQAYDEGAYKRTRGAAVNRHPGHFIRRGTLRMHADSPIQNPGQPLALRCTWRETR